MDEDFRGNTSQRRTVLKLRQLFVAQNFADKKNE